jgi:hypothetical protein
MSLRALERATLLCEPAGTSEGAPPMTVSTFPSSPDLISALDLERGLPALADRFGTVGLDLPYAEATHQLEMTVRAPDPSMSRATHVLDLRIADHRREEGTG